MDDIVYGANATVVVTVPSEATGQEVTIKVDGVVVGNATIAGTTATLNVSDLAVGTYEVVAEFNGTSGNATFNVARANATLNITADDIVVGENATINISSNVPMGNVIVYINGNRNEIILDADGNYVLNVAGLVAGDYAIVANLAESANYTAASNDTVQFSVEKLNTTVDVSNAANNITVTVNSTATGYITVTFEGKNYTAIVNNGIVMITVPNEPGDHNINVYYSGDDKFNVNSTSTSITIPSGNITVSVDDVVYGMNATVVVTVPAGSAGNVDIKVDGVDKGNASISGTSATLDVGVLDAGTHTVEAIFNGTIATGTFKVLPANATVSVSVDSIIVGETANVNISSNVARGNVTVIVNGRTETVMLGDDGRASVPFVGLVAGNYTAVVMLAESTNYGSAVNTTDFTVDKLDTNVDAVSSGNVITVTVNSTATGYVTVPFGGKNYTASVNAGVAVIELPKVPGSYDLTVYYSGDNKFNANSTTVSVVIPSTNITVEVDDIAYGESAHVVVTVPAGSTGNVAIKVDGNPAGSAPITGTTATLDVAGLDAGSHTVVADYNGTSGEASFNVARANATLIVVADSIVAGETATVKITSNVPMGVVTVYVNGKKEVVTLDAGGKYNLDVTGLAAGNYTVVAVLAESTNYNMAVNDTSFTVSKVDSSVSVSVSAPVIVYGDNEVVRFTVSGIDGSVVPVGEFVTVVVTDKNGAVVYSNSRVMIGDNHVELPVIGAGDDYKVVVSYAGDDKYNAASGSAMFDISKAGSSIDITSSVVVKYGNTVSIPVSIVNETTVTFKLVSGGSVVPATIDIVDGKVVISDVLNVGEYDLTVNNQENANYTASSANVHITVDKGMTFKDLQEIIDNATPGSVVKVPGNVVFDPSVDNESGVIVNKPITLDFDGHTIDANGNGRVFNITSDDVAIENGNVVNANATDEDIISVAAENVTIAGMTLENNTVSGDGSVIGVSDSTDVAIEDNVFKGNDVTGDVISVEDSTGTDVSGNSVEDNSVDGNIVDIKNSKDSTVVDNTLSGNDLSDGAAINVEGSNNTSVNDNAVSDNTLNDASVVSVDDSIGTTVADNTLSGNDVTGGDVVAVKDSDDTEVSDNTLSGNDVTGGSVVAVSGSDDTSVSGNDLFGNDVTDGAAISVDDSTGTDVVGNALEGNNLTGSNAVVVKDSNDTSVANNTLFDNVVSDASVVDVVGSDNTEVSDNALSGNDVANGDVIGVDDSTGTTVADNSLTGNYVANGDVIGVKDSENTGIGSNTLSGNVVSDGSVVDVVGSNDTTVGDNALTDNAVTNGDVISVDSSKGTDVAGNSLTGNNIADGDLVGVTGSKDTVIENNDINENVIPVGREIIGVEDSVGTDVEDNRIADNIPLADVDDVVVDEDVVMDLPKDATGNVTLDVGGKTITVPVVNGSAVIPEDLLPVGNYTATLTYGGDDKYGPVTRSLNITVDKGIVVNAPDVTKYYKGSERFQVTVTDNAGVPLAGKTVTITINGIGYKRTTDDSGAVSIPLNLNSGVYGVSVVVDNITVKAVVTILPTVNGTDVVKVFRNATQYYATFRDSTGKYLAQGTTVRFNINGVMYTHVVDANGLAKLNINLPQGSYIITAYNPVTGEACANNITVIPLIVENNDLVKYYRNGSQFVVKVIDSTGKAASGLTVTYNVNGVFYYRTTDADGYARLNINLPPGDYVITTEYGGCRVANNIKVLPVLTASDMVKKYGSPDQFVATVVDGQGRPYAGQTVTFNINGVIYSKVSDSDGKVRLNIDLPVGEYIITSSYNSYSTSNKITITS